jgi:hypothetical protein
MIDDFQGRTVFYDIYTGQQTAEDPTKENTGLFFHRGRLGAPIAVVAPGGTTRVRSSNRFTRCLLNSERPTVSADWWLASLNTFEVARATAPNQMAPARRHRVRGKPMFDLMRDVRCAARRLTHAVFTLATLLMLALGIGANTAILARRQHCPPQAAATYES